MIKVLQDLSKKLDINGDGKVDFKDAIAMLSGDAHSDVGMRMVLGDLVYKLITSSDVNHSEDIKVDIKVSVDRAIALLEGLVVTEVLSVAKIEDPVVKELVKDAVDLVTDKVKDVIDENIDKVTKSVKASKKSE